MASGQVEDVDLPADDYDDVPKWVIIAKGELGQTEYLPKNKKKPNPRVSNYFKVAEARPDPLGTPWCKYFVDYCLASAKLSHPKGNGLARSYLSYGNMIYDHKAHKGSLSAALPGDIVVNWRGSRNDGVTGHVFFYLRHDRSYIYGIGGNQGDSVTEAKFPITKLLAIVRPRPVAANSRTVRASVAAAVSETTATTLRTVTPDTTSTEFLGTQADQLQTTAMTLAPIMKYGAMVLTIVAVILMLYVVYRRIADYKETGL